MPALSLKPQPSTPARLIVGLACWLIFCSGWSSPPLRAGHWTPLANAAPGAVNLMLLLPDGTVMAADNDGIGNIGYKWYKLTPDIHGSYVNGTWTTLAPMHYTRLYYASAVLRDGRVFVAGGEYGTGTTNAEVYDPQSNVWSILAVPPGLITTNNVLGFTGNNQSGFVDAGCFTLPDGRLLIMPTAPATNGLTVIFDPSSDIISQGPAYPYASAEEQGFVKLPDGGELTVGLGQAAIRYLPYLNPPQGKWRLDQPVPVPLVSNGDEIGPGFLLPNGNVFWVGGSPVTALYTPSGNTNQGSWTPGPAIPNGLGTSDASGAMMVNGKILCAVGSYTNYNAPTWFYEYDYAANAFNTNIPAPGNPAPGSSDNVASYQTAMLDLPDGTVLYSHERADLYVYSPDSGPLAAGKPVIQSITMNSDGSYHLVGTGLNGISQGAAYGDDLQMDSNYPLVRLDDGNGHIYYGRTFNWSSTGVQTGTNIVTTEFTVPVSGGAYSLAVVANGIASDPVFFYGPVWVDFNYNTNAPQVGTFTQPFSTLAQGTNAVGSGATIFLKPGHSPETMRIAKAMKLTAVGGTATIGR